MHMCNQAMVYSGHGQSIWWPHTTDTLPLLACISGHVASILGHLHLANLFVEYYSTYSGSTQQGGGWLWGVDAIILVSDARSIPLGLLRVEFPLHQVLSLACQEMTISIRCMKLKCPG